MVEAMQHLRRLSGAVLTGLAVACIWMVASARAATITVTTTADDPTGDALACSLTEAIIAANRAAARGGCPAGTPAGSNTIVLQAGATYTLTEPDQPEAGQVDRGSWYGPDGLPAIASTITIDGNGATIARAVSAPPFRLLFVGANPLAAATFGYTTPGAGNLTLENLTLAGGLAQGGSSEYGGGGAGLGGALFSQGSITLDAVTLSGNQAQGGDSGDGSGATGGGGIGTDAIGGSAGGFGPGSFGGPTGGSAGMYGGGGGAGFATGENGATAPTTEGTGSGGGPATGTGGEAVLSQGNSAAGDGSGGGSTSCTGGFAGGAGGNFGAGGTGGVNLTPGGGGGGVGGGGGGANGAWAGGGGFGGGGGGLFDYADCGGGGGGFGGGGGSGSDSPVPGSAGPGGFGGGTSGIGAMAIGGGGAGMGGAIFNQQGTLAITNSTLSGNGAAGGTGANPGWGLGGAIFNLSGSISISSSTLSANSAPQGGGGIYNLVYDKATARQASVTTADSIVYANGAAADAVSDMPATVSDGGANLGSASTAFPGPNIADTLGTLGGGTISGTPLTANPSLGTLQFNGGPGMATLALQPGSPALKVGTNCPSVDERGVARASGLCDLGAFQLSTAPQSTKPPSPILSGLKVFPRTFSVAGRKLNGRCVKATTKNKRHKSCRLPFKLRITFKVNEAAGVTLTVKLHAPGRKVNRRCVAPSNKNKKRGKCTRLVGVHGAITRSATTGTNSFTFNGRIAGHTLGPGTYQLTITATANGHTSTPRTATFKLES